MPADVLIAVVGYYCFYRIFIVGGPLLFGSVVIECDVLVEFRDVAIVIAGKSNVISHLLYVMIKLVNSGVYCALFI